MSREETIFNSPELKKIRLKKTPPQSWLQVSKKIRPQKKCANSKLPPRNHKNKMTLTSSPILKNSI